MNTKRGPNVNRNVGKLWWRNVYFNWDNEQFKSKFRLTKDNFNIILNRHGCTFTVIGNVFGISKSLATQTFNHVVRELVVNLFDEYVKMSSTEEEWINEIKGFIENYEFPCIGALDGFHVYVCSKLRNHFNFKHRYSIPNIGLVEYNKRFLNLTVGAPGRTHDARFLRNTGLFKQNLNGQGLPDKTVDLGDEYGKIPLVTIGDSAFPRFSCLLKNFNRNTNDERERYYNIKMNSVRVVTENCYGMLKSRWRILYKKAESRVFNLKYIGMRDVA